MKKFISMVIIGIMTLVMMVSTVAFAGETTDGDIDVSEKLSEKISEMLHALSDSARNLIENNKEDIDDVQDDIYVDTEGFDIDFDIEDTGDSTGESSGESSGEYNGIADLMSYFVSLLGLDEYEDFDWAEFYADLDERRSNGEVLTLEDVLPEPYCAMFSVAFNMAGDDDIEEIAFDDNNDIDIDYLDDIEDEEEINIANDVNCKYSCKGNQMTVHYTINSDVEADRIDKIVDTLMMGYSDAELLKIFTESFEKLAFEYNIDLEDVTLRVEIVDSDENVLFENTMSYAEIIEIVDQAELDDLDDADFGDWFDMTDDIIDIDTED